MNLRHPRAAVVAIWGLVAAFAVTQVIAWIVLGGASRPAVFILQFVTAWVLILILAIVSTVASVVSPGRSRNMSRPAPRLSIRSSSSRFVTPSCRSFPDRLTCHWHSRRWRSESFAWFPATASASPCCPTTARSSRPTRRRVNLVERRARPRPDVVFKAERTALGAVTRSREPLIIDDTSVGAADFLDINVLHTAALGSALILPLVAKGRAVGTLNAVSRQTGAFNQQHVDALLPMAEIFAVAYIAQHLADRAGQVPNDGSDVGADAVDRLRDQQRSSDDHRAL